MSTHNIRFHGEIRKILHSYSFLSGAMRYMFICLFKLSWSSSLHIYVCNGVYSFCFSVRPFICSFLPVCIFVCPSIVLVEICIKVFALNILWHLYYQGLLMESVYVLPAATCSSQILLEYTATSGTENGRTRSWVLAGDIFDPLVTLSSLFG